MTDKKEQFARAIAALVMVPAIPLCFLVEHKFTVAGGPGAGFIAAVLFLFGWCLLFVFSAH
jgi:hypothetical protein